MSEGLDELLAIAKSLAESAGDIVRAGTQKRQAVDTKSTDTDVVTAIDRASEYFIVEELMKRRPADGIVGEEGASVTGTSGVEWHVDPLDGTVNFLYRLPFFAVSIGAVVDGEPVAGAVYNPILDELFWACRGGGAYLHDQVIVANRSTTDIGACLLATGFSYDPAVRDREGGVVHRLLPVVRDIRRLGAAALDLCHVACGRVDAYYEARVHSWDVSAGTIIAREAGALVTGVQGDGAPDSDVLAACSPEVYRDLRALVNQP